METDSFNINWLKEQTIEKLEKVLPGCGLTKYLDDIDQTGFRLIYMKKNGYHFLHHFILMIFHGA